MIFLINLTPTEEAQLSDEARQKGFAAEQLVESLIREHLVLGPASIADTVHAKLRQWQEETGTVVSPPVSSRELFARWAEEDSLLSEAEHAAAENVWQDFQKGIDEERVNNGMRTLFS